MRPDTIKSVVNIADMIINIIRVITIQTDHPTQAFIPITSNICAFCDSFSQIWFLIADPMAKANPKMIKIVSTCVVYKELKKLKKGQSFQK